MKNKMTRQLCAALIISLLFSQLIACSKPQGSPSHSPSPSAAPAAKVSGTISKESPRVGTESLALDMGNYPLSKDSKCEITQIEAPAPLQGVSIRAYSFKLSSDEELLSVMKLTLPYNEEALAGKKAQGNIAAAYYNESSREWEPVPFVIDEKAKTVTIHTDHLSVYGCFEITNENTRKAYAEYAIPAFAKSRLNDAKANALIISSVQNGGNPGAGAVEAGLSALDLGIAVSGAGLETAGHIAGALGSDGAARSSLLNGVNEKLGDLGLLCSIAQVANGMYNIYNGDKDAIFPCYGNALKTGIGYVAGKMGAGLFSLASIGTLAIELSLNEFAETAWSGRQDIYEKAYALYYESPSVKRDARTWAKLFIEAKNGAANAEKYKLRVEGLVQRYAEQFWQDEKEVAFYQAEAQKHGFTGGGGLNDKIKADISKRYGDELFRSVLQDAFKLIAEKEAANAERALLRELNAVKKELNKTCTLELIDTTVSADKPSSGYAGAAVYVDVPANVTDAKSWSTTLNLQGGGKISFTVLGYLMAGAPKSLKLYKSGSTTSGAADLSIAFDAALPVTTVKYKSPDVTKTAPPSPVTSKSPPSPVISSSQPSAKQFSWVLVETNNSDAKAYLDSTNKGGIYQVSATASPGSYTYSHKYIGKTDTYPDPDQINGEGYAVRLDITVPPSTIKAGETITLQFKLSFTSQNISYFDGSGNCRADIANTRFVNGNGKNFFEIYCSVKYSSKNVLSVSDTITAKAPTGRSEGERIKLWTGGTGPSGGIGTTYVYEWKAV